MADLLNVKNYGMDYHGKTSVEKDENVIIWTNGFPGVIGVAIDGETGADFMISEIPDTQEDIEDDDFTKHDMAEANYSDDTYVEMKTGMSAYKVSNDSGSTDSLKVTWRIIRP